MTCSSRGHPTGSVRPPKHSSILLSQIGMGMGNPVEPFKSVGRLVRRAAASLTARPLSHMCDERAEGGERDRETGASMLVHALARPHSGGPKHRESREGGWTASK